MPGLDLLLAFAAATAVFAYFPGPALLYTAAQTLARGRRAGLMAALGIHLGCYAHVFAAAFGLSAVFRHVPELYAALKIVGALYLVVLGIGMLRSRGTGAAEAAAPAPKTARRAFLESVLVELLNPKVAIFFIAFLPQFVDPSASLPISAAVPDPRHDRQLRLLLRRPRHGLRGGDGDAALPGRRPRAQAPALRRRLDPRRPRRAARPRPDLTMRLDLLSELNAERAARRAAVLVTDLASGEQRLVREAEVDGDPLAEALADRLRLGKSGVVESEGRQAFLSVQVPPVKVVAIGAVHISQALAPMARNLDLDMIVIDPRTAFATPERFPDVSVVAEWPDAALPGIGLDRYTAVAALTHDPKIDDPALAAALRAECFYIGALGSRKTHARRVERLTAAGFSQAEIARIQAPIGLDIGAVSPAEIAVSILAEIVATLRRDRRRAA